VPWESVLSSEAEIMCEGSLQMKNSIIFLMAFFCMVCSDACVFAADEPTGDLSTPEVVGELLWVRPLGFMNVGLGAIFYVISLPVTLPLRKADEAKKFLITYPYEYHIKRPIGKM